MILPLAYYGDPVLRKKGKKVDAITPEIKTLVNDMIETMRHHNGIGLAAPQVHHSLAIFITEVPIKVSEEQGGTQWVPGELRIFINPTILNHSSEQWNLEEGCLSIPKIYGEVIRPVSIVVKATNLDGEIFEQEFSWLDARAIMHENDHINGVLYIDRIHGHQRRILDAPLEAIKKKYTHTE